MDSDLSVIHAIMGWTIWSSNEAPSHLELLKSSLFIITLLSVLCIRHYILFRLKFGFVNLRKNMTTANDRSFKTNLAYLSAIHKTKSNSTDRDVY